MVLQPDPCHFLPWDSDHFGFPIARVSGATMTSEVAVQVDAWCRQAGIRCAYFQTDVADTASARAAEDAGFRLVDIRLSFSTALEPGHAQPGGSSLRAATAEEGPHLEAIARTAYQMTRFYADPGFPVDRSDALYATWIRRSLEGQAEAVLVTGVEGGPTGFITCHRLPDHRGGRIGLVGVAAGHQGRGLGRQLIRGAFEWFRSADAPSVEVATQARNLRAQRLYQECGFRIAEAALWFHRWWV